MTKQNDTWPKRADGTNKTIGEMTPEESERVTREAVQKVAKQMAPLGIAVQFGGTIPAGRKH
jgi:hypothetical protein